MPLEAHLYQPGSDDRVLSHSYPFDSIQGALCPVRSENVSYTDTAGRVTTAFTYPIIRVISTTDCYVKLGNGTVNATTGDVYLPAGAIEYFHRKTYTHLSAIRVASSGTINVSEMY